MLFTEEILFKGDRYCVIHREVDNLIMDVIDEHKSIWKSYIGTVHALYSIDEYQLMLDDVIFASRLMKENEQFLNHEPIVNEETGEKQFYDLHYPIHYSGGIVIAKDPIKGYCDDVILDHPCYYYRTVYELIFKDGSLTTSIDHSKSMHRIRKNIDTGLRTESSGKDLRCIRKFVKECFCRSYEMNRRHRSVKRKFYKVK